MVAPKNYNHQRFAQYLEKLVKSRGTTYRDASLRADMDHSAITRFRGGQLPRRDSCIMLAHALDSDPNEMLKAAGYEPLPMLDRSLVDPNDFPNDIKEFAAGLKKIPPERRRELFIAFRTMARADFETD